MAGIGKYSKGKKFQLKSGNAPAFKMMAGESPITAPVKNTDEDTSENTETTEVKKPGKGKKFLKGLGNVLVSGLTGGLDAVYGSGKIVTNPSAKYFSDKDEKNIDKKNQTLQDLLAENTKLRKGYMNKEHIVGKDKDKEKES